MKSEFPIYRTFWMDKGQRQLFKDKALVVSWAASYPFLFDKDDLRIAQKQAKGGYHYFEWLAAILLYHLEGLFSFVEKYQFSLHKHKREILQKLAGDDLIAYMEKHAEFGRTQCPDLLVYDKGLHNWFFAEVKGPGDKLRATQVRFFRTLERMSGRPVRVIEFRYR